QSLERFRLPVIPVARDRHGLRRRHSKAHHDRVTVAVLRQQRLEYGLRRTGMYHGVAPSGEHADASRDEPRPWQSLKRIAQVIATGRFDRNGRSEEVL